jgi:hypothetical protein
LIHGFQYDALFDVVDIKDDTTIETLGERSISKSGLSKDPNQIG